MTNLRIISDNAIDRATLATSSTAGALVVTNLQSDKKSSVWRATGIGARIEATWSVAELIQAVAAPFCNWSPTATWRGRLTNEVVATNLLLQSEALENAAYTKSGVSISTTGLAPSGVAAGRFVKEGSTVGAHYIEQAYAVLPSTTYTLSLFVKANGRTSGQLGYGTASALFDLSAGVIVSAGGAGYVSSAITPSTNGYYRVSVCFTTPSSGSATAALLLGNSSGSLSYTGDNASGMYVWGFQLETGTVATSYFPTTSAATTRPLGYIDSWQSYAYDSGSVLACPAPAVTLRGWTAAQSASAYAYGGGACARTWLPAAISAYGMVLDIVDINNVQGYLEAARLVCGPYWSPTYNASTLSATNVDLAIHTRTDAGDLWTDASTIHKKVPIELEYMPEADLTILDDILRASRAYPIFLSVFPGNANLALERKHTVYGKRMSDSEVAVQAAIMYGTKIEVESI